jgi:hypothetical protein
MLRFGLRCVLTYYQYAPRAPRPKPRLTKSEIAAVRGVFPTAVGTARLRSTSPRGATGVPFPPEGFRARPC